jgi:hypothetical protein
MNLPWGWMGTQRQEMSHHFPCLVWLDVFWCCLPQSPCLIPPWGARFWILPCGSWCLALPCALPEQHGILKISPDLRWWYSCSVRASLSYTWQYQQLLQTQTRIGWTTRSLLRGKTQQNNSWKWHWSLVQHLSTLCTRGNTKKYV